MFPACFLYFHLILSSRLITCSGSWVSYSCCVWESTGKMLYFYNFLSKEMLDFYPWVGDYLDVGGLVYREAYVFNRWLWKKCVILIYRFEGGFVGCRWKDCSRDLYCCIWILYFWLCNQDSPDLYLLWNYYQHCCESEDDRCCGWPYHYERPFYANF